VALFDAYVFIDWSAKNERSSAKPSPDAIWIGEKVGADERPPTYWRGREQASAHVRERLEGTLGAWFDSTTLDDNARCAVVEEEGWILGCPA
jgi:hypothetical protein